MLLKELLPVVAEDAHHYVAPAGRSPAILKKTTPLTLTLNVQSSDNLRDTSRVWGAKGRDDLYYPCHAPEILSD